MKLNYFFLFLILSYHSSSSCAGAAGAPVTDVGSYSYYVKQIEKLAEQTGQLNKLLSFSKLTKQGVDEVAKVVVGTYNTTVDLSNALSKLKKNASDLPLDVRKQWDKELGKSQRVFEPFISMDKYFVDRYGTDYQSRYYRELVRDQAIKRLAINAEDNLKESKRMIEYISKLQSRIGKTKTLKESSDLQNELLLSMSIAMERIANTQDQLAQLKGISEYQAVSERTKRMDASYASLKKKYKGTWNGETKMNKNETVLTYMKRQTKSLCEKNKKQYPGYTCPSDNRQARGF